MPQQKQLSWAQLRVGVLVLVSLTVLAVGIFFISGQIGILSRRYTLRTYLSTAGGVREGADVRLAGIAVGNVHRIRISPFTDPARAVEIQMRITRGFQDDIRGDSEATVATLGLLGEGYIDISRGSPAQPPIPDGGVVKSHEQADIKAIVQNTNDVISNLRVVSAKLGDITNQIGSGKGSMGKLIYDQALYNRMSQTTDALQKLVTRTEQGQGTLGKFMTDETIYNRSIEALNHLNQLIDKVQHGNGSMPKLINDPAVYNNLQQLTARANTLIDNINKGQGTLGKLVTDQQLYTRMNTTVDHLDTITARMAKGEGTLGKLSTDPTLYNNLSVSAQTLREFLTEFMKNPKKFLTLRLHIF